MSETTAWVVLIISGLLEIGWAIGLKYSEGLTKLNPTIFTIIVLSLGMYLFAKATHVLPFSTAYGVWVGVGTIGTAILGIVLFQESISIVKLTFLVMLLVSIIGLKLSSN